ncbi:integral membrane protein TmpA [Aspergillus brunneoviolaceus CBS 621.78]|uniref:Integral membrane protein TmpA n=1 Tax=Aspergillus brunneoviolaceus CBS 621.78 TaxID=1450534 RepID=A0ACD1GAU1_9EURO|nr:integral membrane protein TmpA [Aspergillus brunneoviolaceus CBS 621.78]RAH46373.1 integral membrane protein TmpA [Aspergillus brunneoviolaceus CBS 621.78]
MSCEVKSTITVPPAVVYASGPQSPTSSTFTEDSTIKVFSEKAEVSRYRDSEDGSLDLEAQAPKKRKFAAIRFIFLNIYRRLFSLVFLANVAVFVAVMATDRKLLALVNAAAGNLLACGLARQPLVVNSIFVIVASIPRSAPLRIRRIAAKVYHYGGVHSGCGIASFVWYAGFVGLLSREYWSPSPSSSSGGPTISVAPVILAYLILVVLLAIIVVAYPGFRIKKHDYFELIHRFFGWLVVVLFVILLMVFADEVSRASNEPLGPFLARLPAFWFLVLTVVAIVHPWTLLRKVAVQPETLSSHAVRLHLSHTTTTFGKGIQLARHPLRDWHGFATFPNPDGGRSFSCLVSKAGDWTAACIQDPPTHLWKRGVLLYGFAYAMRVFTRVVVVTTGSGIGPCLSFLGDDHRPALRVVWQTRAPLKTYGQRVLDLVSMMDPTPVVVDTNQSGRVDLVPMIRRIVQDFDAEAVCVISNPVFTRKVVYELESRGIPAFGPIFDS